MTQRATSDRPYGKGDGGLVGGEEGGLSGGKGDSIGNQVGYSVKGEGDVSGNKSMQSPRTKKAGTSDPWAQIGAENAQGGRKHIRALRPTGLEEAGTHGQRSPRHQPRSEPPFVQLDGIL
jgi:hypothetical protein